jgi:hypothetical protein
MKYIRNQKILKKKTMDLNNIGAKNNFTKKDD